VRADEASRALAIAHDSPIEPEAILRYDGVGLLARDAVRPFDRQGMGSLSGEGAAAIVLEAEDSARERGAPPLGEYLGGASVSEGEGFLPVRDDGDGLERAIRLALDDAGLRAAEIGLIVAHGNGNRRSDGSEARALGRVFGDDPPPATAWKWLFGHLFAAAAVVETTLALVSLRQRSLPGIATLREIDPACAGMRVSREPQRPRADTALVLSRGFAGANAALVLRGAVGTAA
jgi:3-oxoacyl-[acyl-carrier-protein] synthase-1